MMYTGGEGRGRGDTFKLNLYRIKSAAQVPQQTFMSMITSFKSYCMDTRTHIRPSALLGPLKLPVKTKLQHGLSLGNKKTPTLEQNII